MTTGLARRRLFVATILAGSFLLFLVQPMVARMALPRLGGAPNVWNSAMLVYQALLLAGYAYAHALGRLALRTQAWVHAAVLVAAGATLPIALADLPPPMPGSEVLWVPLLFAATIGPVFFAVSAQAPLLQRWFAADAQAGDPYPLYAASNLGSFAGLIAYPLLVEPMMPLRAQSWLWAAGYAVVVGLTVLAGRLPASQAAPAPTEPPARTGGVPLRRMALWLVLAAVPSGLMLSSTTFLTTDVVAMPMLWVIPLGIYLLSFSIAFAERRGFADAVARHAAMGVLILGGITFLMTTGQGTLLPAIVSLLLLAVVAVALHGRLYALRPDPAHLTLFYLIMAAGGVLGGAFTALVAPLAFDWSWEHPLLIVMAALLVPTPVFADWADHLGVSPARRTLVLGLLVAATIFGASLLLKEYAIQPRPVLTLIVLGGLVMIGAMLVVRWRPAFAALIALIMLSLGGLGQVKRSVAGERSRSYFGIYTVGRDGGMRTMFHGTTLHGLQMAAAGAERQPTTYYGHTSGIGLALGAGDRLLGPGARVGIVGLGAGTLACYRQPGQAWTFFEIDPAVLAYSRNGTFTFIERCAPQTRVVIGDARLELAKVPAKTFDLLAIDAFTSDSVPLHLLTREAFATYRRALRPDGILMVHISNRFIDLAPAMAAAARASGLHAAIRIDKDVAFPLTPSAWVAMTADPARLTRLKALGKAPWVALPPPAETVWTDDYASVLPAMRWSKLR